MSPLAGHTDTLITRHPKDLRGSWVGNWGIRPNILIRKRSFCPYHSGDHKGCRDSVSGTRDKDQGCTYYVTITWPFKSYKFVSTASNCDMLYFHYHSIQNIFSFPLCFFCDLGTKSVCLISKYLSNLFLLLWISNLFPLWNTPWDFNI